MLSLTAIGFVTEERQPRVVDDAVGRCGAAWADLARRLSGELDLSPEDRWAGMAPAEGRYR